MWKIKKSYKEFEEECNILRTIKGRKEGRLTGFVTSCVGSASYNTLF